MRVVHDADGEQTTLATTVDLAESFLSKGRGLTFRRSIPADYALVFPFGSPGTRRIHTLFVFEAIDAVWTVDEEVQRVETLQPWTPWASATADTLIEFPAGAAEGVAPGDRVRVEGVPP